MATMSQSQLAAYEARQQMMKSAREHLQTPRASIAQAATIEAALHREIMDECARRGWLPIHGRMDMAATVTVGSPDFVILADGERTIYIEAKAGNRKPSTEQLAFHAWARRLGHTVHVVRSLSEFMEVIKCG